MKKFTLLLKMLMFGLLCLLFYAFSPLDLLEEQTLYLQKKLIDHYDTDQDKTQIKQYELKVTNSGFCRYKRHYANGKIEYFSFNFSKFKEWITWVQLPTAKYICVRKVMMSLYKRIMTKKAMWTVWPLVW